MSDLAVEGKDDVVWVRLMRPERRNAYDAAMAAELTQAVEASADEGGVVVITGTEDSFCAGGFLADLAEPDPRELERLFEGALRLFTAIRRNPRPVIAAVNGPAVGGGNELVVACDIAIAAESAYLGQNGPRIGSAPVLGGTNMLALAVGEKRAREVAFMCRRYPARKALELGWINEVVADELLEETTQAWAQELLAMSPRYLRIAKTSANVWWNACQDSYSSGLGMLGQAVGSEDMIEGASAFMEKRRPRFARDWKAE